MQGWFPLELTGLILLQSKDCEQGEVKIKYYKSDTGVTRFYLTGAWK